MQKENQRRLYSYCANIVRMGVSREEFGGSLAKVGVGEYEAITTGLPDKSRSLKKRSAVNQS